MYVGLKSDIFSNETSEVAKLCIDETWRRLQFGGNGRSLFEWRLRFGGNGRDSAYFESKRENNKIKYKNISYVT